MRHTDYHLTCPLCGLSGGHVDAFKTTGSSPPDWFAFRLELFAAAREALRDGWHGWEVPGQIKAAGRVRGVYVPLEAAEEIAREAGARWE